jgi:hypothetical protein
LGLGESEWKEGKELNAENVIASVKSERFRVGLRQRVKADRNRSRTLVRK